MDKEFKGVALIIVVISLSASFLINSIMITNKYARKSVSELQTLAQIKINNYNECLAKGGKPYGQSGCDFDD